MQGVVSEVMGKESFCPIVICSWNLPRLIGIKAPSGPERANGEPMRHYEVTHLEGSADRRAKFAAHPNIPNLTTATKAWDSAQKSLHA